MERELMERPNAYSPDVANAILREIAEGGFLSKICARPDMPDRAAFYQWMATREDLSKAWAKARLAWADYWAEKSTLIALDGSQDFFIDENGKTVTDHANVQRARLQCDHIKWLVGKYAPRTYGEKTELLDAAKADPQEQFVVRWERIETTIVEPRQPAQVAEQPKQIAYHKPELPGDLSETDWANLVDVLDVIKRVAPSDAEPGEVLQVIRKALLSHYAVEAV